MSRTWLDTFDWRLYAAGLALEWAGDDAAAALTLRLPDGRLLRAAVPGLSPPVHVADLPAGPLRDALAGPVWPRALLPVATVTGSVAENRVRNRDEKTVARVLIDRPDTGAGWIAVSPLRGYEGAAARIARRLSRVDGIVAATGTPYDDALAVADRSPNGYRTSAVPKLQPETPATVAIAAILGNFAAAMYDNAPGVIDAIDTEFLHDFRVAVRRTRSVLKLTGDAMQPDLIDRFGAEFRWLGDLTTPVRDLDVYLLGFPDMAAGLTSADPRDLEPFRVFLRRHRATERRRLVRGLRSRRFQRLMTEWPAELAAVQDDSGPAIADVARRRVELAFRRVIKHGERITADSPGDMVHALRKRCKELRYLLEVFRSLHEPTAHRRLVAELKKLQDCLGDFQDGEVQREAVRAFAAAMMDEGRVPAPTVLAMGELAAQLDARQLRARAELVGRLGPFLSQKNRARIATLTGESR